MKTRFLALFLVALAACATKRYEPLPDPQPGPIWVEPTPTPAPVPVPPKPSPEEPKDGAVPASLFAPLVEGTTTYNEVVKAVGTPVVPRGNPDQSGTWWYIWPKVDCPTSSGSTVLFAVLGFQPRPGTTATTGNFVLLKKKVCR